MFQTVDMNEKQHPFVFIIEDALLNDYSYILL